MAQRRQLQRLPANADADLLFNVLEEDGAAIIEGAISVDVIERFNRELDPLSEATTAQTEAIYNPKFPPQAKYVSGLVSDCKTFRDDILNNDVIHAICKAIFKPTGDYWLSSAFLREVEPGLAEQDFHRDEATHPLLRYQKPDAPPIVLSFILALTEFTMENGATRVFPGSHRWGEVGKPSPDQAVLAEMKPGDMLVMRQGIVHSGGKNTEDSSRYRRAVLVYFNSCQLTPFETFVTMPREVVETMTPLAQKMIGWRTVKPELPNVTGLHTCNLALLEDVLQLKSNQ
ncbi:Verruculogen synthase [Aspergillus filifer]